ncbi:response regulator [Peptococcaceae bacterium]|nr:response regulator [Peptococcaceae bacterium]
MRMMIKNIVTKAGYEVVGEAENGAQAVEMYKELKSDLVIMDIIMPEMDGIQAVKAIKEIDPNANIIMCSAMGQQAMVMEAIQAGAKDFIVKPFQQDRILQAIKRII